MSRAVLAAMLAGGLAGAGLAELAAAGRGARRRSRRLVGLLAALGRRLGPRGAAPADLAARVAAAGTPLGLAESDVMAIKAGGALAGLGLAALLATALPVRAAALLACALGASGFLAPDLLLRRRIHDRRRRMERELPDVLELVRVALEAGLPLTRALAEVGRRRGGALAAELRRAAREVELGVPRPRALGALTLRCPAAGMPALVAAVERAERLGAPLATTLAAQARDARSERARRIRERAERAAPKIQLVIALGLVPSAMLLVAAAMLASLT